MTDTIKNYQKIALELKKLEELKKQLREKKSQLVLEIWRTGFRSCLKITKLGSIRPGTTTNTLSHNQNKSSRLLRGVWGERGPV